MLKIPFLWLSLWMFVNTSLFAQDATEYYQEPYRPQFHFTPEAHWMNDPNGLVYHNGNYHLFYQYYPEDIVWGPMHWGHAISKDLVHWEHQPVALYPDSLGYVFSGSAILDRFNTSGLGTAKNPPLVAAYTIFDPVKAENKEKDNQTQGLAYSLDGGTIWEKYPNNPIIPNLEFEIDFRDPKLFWNDQINAWTIALVGGDHVQFWKSNDLKSWNKMSVFGKDLGAHGGVWECPDIFPLTEAQTGVTKWVMLVSINPGAPNGGSGTQYFVGDFDGTTFRTNQTTPLWLDQGTDNYAGITFNDEPHKERIFIGWMSNWNYAQQTPTQKWRSAMTLSRKLSLREVDGQWRLFNYPVESLDRIIKKTQTVTLSLEPEHEKRIQTEALSLSEVLVTLHQDVDLQYENELGEKLLIQVLPSKGKIRIDRSQSGEVDFHESFSKVQEIDLSELSSKTFELRMILDRSSLELFVNKGQFAATVLVFNTQSFTALKLFNPSKKNSAQFEGFTINPIQSIWK